MEKTMVQEISAFVQSPILRAAAIGILILVLLIPLTVVGGLVSERESTRNAVEMEVAEKWGGSQSLIGPILSIPYRYRIQGPNREVIVQTGQARFLPSSLEIEGEVRPEIRYRGIYEVALYEVGLAFSGEFERPDLGRFKIAPEDVLWDEAVLLVGIPDLRGIKGAIAARWGEESASFEPGTAGAGICASGIHARVPRLDRHAPGDRIPFSFELRLNGSRELRFSPLGRETRLSLASSWPSPSFSGQFLPDTREVTPQGFSANWNISYLTRPFPQEWRDHEVAAELLTQWTAGVNLFRPVDSYAKTSRTTKYGILFLFMTFAVYFLFEILGRIRIHPFQYLLVGFALCLFYLLLLSLSEHLGFGRSYLVASAAIVGLISAYSGSVLRSLSRAAAIGAGLAGLYGYLYVLLQLEDYALLLGSLGLFALLAAAMALTRKVDWYAVGR
jgi:inner membrane protein